MLGSVPGAGDSERKIGESALVEVRAQRGRQTKPAGKLLGNSDHCYGGNNEDVRGQICRQRMEENHIRGLGRASGRPRPERSKGVTPVKVLGERSRYNAQQGQKALPWLRILAL